MWGEEGPSSAVWRFQAVSLEVLLLIQAFNFKQVLLPVLLGTWGVNPTSGFGILLAAEKGRVAFPAVCRRQLQIPCGRRKRLELGAMVGRGRRSGAQGRGLRFGFG